MSYTQFRHEVIERGEFKHLVYVVFGDEDFLRYRCVQLSKALAASKRWETVTLFASETSPSQLLNEATTLPFGTSRKVLFYFDDADLLESKNRLLDRYFAEPSTGTTLFVISDIGNFACPGQNVFCVRCSKPFEPQLAKWVKAEFQEKKKSITDDLVKRIIDRCNKDMFCIRNAVDRLVDYAKGKPYIKAEDVDLLVPANALFRTFELAKWTARANAQNAIRVLHGLLESGENIQMIVSALGWYIRKAVEAKRYLLAGKKPADLGKALGIKYNPYEFVNLVQPIPVETLLAKHTTILQTDIALKTSVALESAILYKCVVELCSSTQSRVKE
jgi:DNA polymerase III delta subunit